MRDSGQLNLRVGATPGNRNRPLAEIASEDLDWKRCGKAADRFSQAHRYRVDLLPSRTARHPYTQRESARPFVQQPRQNLSFERLENLGIAEETGDVDQDVIIQGRQF